MENDFSLSDAEKEEKRRYEREYYSKNKEKRRE